MLDNKDNYKISIITVCFNAKETIEDTILSVIYQTYRNIEYIIIDGGSKDGTLDIINKYRNHIDIIISEPDNGIYDAMNKGIKLANGRYINFMNSGDKFVNKEVIMKLITSIDNLDYDIIFGDEIKKYSWGEILKKGDYFSDKSIGLPFGHQSTFVKATLMKSYLFDTSYRILADQNCIFKMYKDNRTFYHAEFPIAIYNMYGISNNIHLIYKENARINNIFGLKFYYGYFLSLIKHFLYKNLPDKFVNTFQKFKYREYLIDNAKKSTSD